MAEHVSNGKPLSEVAVSMIRGVCADHAKAALANLSDRLSAAEVNTGILRQIIESVLSDERLVDWVEDTKLAIVERIIPSRLHLSPYFDCHVGIGRRKETLPAENDRMGVTWLLSDLSIADPDLFLDPIELLFEQFEGELVSDENVANCELPRSWNRKDAVIIPHKAVEQLLAWKTLDVETVLLRRPDPYLHYGFHTYSTYFDDPNYGALSLVWLMDIANQLILNKAINIDTRSLLLVPIHVGPQSVGSFCFTCERRTFFADRVGLAMIASEVTNWYLDAETELLERRRQTAAIGLPIALNFTHEARHLLTTLDNSLRNLGHFLPPAGGTTEEELLSRAKSAHERLTTLITTFESDLRTPQNLDTMLSTVHLAEALGEMFQKAGYTDIAIVGRSSDTVFVLKGTINSLFQCLEPVVRNGVTAASRQSPTAIPHSELFMAYVEKHDYDFWIDPYKPNDSTSVLVGIHVSLNLKATARLDIRIKDAGKGIPAEVRRSLYNISAFSRLPSDRLDGGRGLLSVVSMLWALYKAQCTYDESDNTWHIPMRVKLVRQTDDSRVVIG